MRGERFEREARGGPSNPAAIIRPEPHHLHDEVTARIIAELEQGRIPWVKPWAESGVPLGLPRSAASRRHYSGINILVLWDAVIRRRQSARRCGSPRRMGEQNRCAPHAK